MLGSFYPVEFPRNKQSFWKRAWRWIKKNAVTIAKIAVMAVKQFKTKGDQDAGQRSQDE